MRLLSRPGSRKSDARRRPATARLRLQALEDRALPSFGFGSAFSVGGTGGDGGYGIALDAAGNMYVAGQFANTVDFDPNDINPTSNHVLTAAPTGTTRSTPSWPSTRPTAPSNGSPTSAPTPDRHRPNRGARLDTCTSRTSRSVVGSPDVATSPAGHRHRAVNWTTTVDGHGADVWRLRSAPRAACTPTASPPRPTQAIVDRLDPATGNVLWTQTSSGGRRQPSGSPWTAPAMSMRPGSTYGDHDLRQHDACRATSRDQCNDAFVWKLNASGGTVWAGSMGSTAGTGIYRGASRRTAAATST